MSQVQSHDIIHIDVRIHALLWLCIYIYIYHTLSYITVYIDRSTIMVMYIYPHITVCTW